MTAPAIQPVVLVAEDNEEDLFLLERSILRGQLNIRLIRVIDGAECIAYLNGQGTYANRDLFPLPGVLLLDLSMPRVGGHQVLDFVRAMPNMAQLPVVVLTSSSNERDINQAISSGVSAFLSKTGDITRLAANLRHILGSVLAYGNFSSVAA